MTYPLNTLKNDFEETIKEVDALGWVRLRDLERDKEYILVTQAELDSIIEQAKED